MASFRVAIGMLLIIDVISRAVDLRAHYSDFGILPRAPFIEKFADNLHVSLHMASGLVEWQAVLFLLTALAGLCVMIGYKTRSATIIAWVLLVSMHNRNTMILDGGDVLFRMLYFWSMFLPLGARFSVDAALNTVPQTKEPRFFSAATIGIIFQISILYLATALLKTGKEWWPDGTASYYALQLDQFVTPFGRWMGTQIQMLQIGTYVVYALELFAIGLLLSPLFFQQIRFLTVIALMFMHWQFDLTMRLGIFPWVDIVALIILLPSSFWDFISKKIKNADRLALKIYYDGTCGFCKKAVYILKTLFLIPETTISEAQSEPKIEQIFNKENSWVVVDAQGTAHTRFNALVTLFERVPLLGPITKLIPLRRLAIVADPVYGKIALNLPTIGRFTDTVLPWNQSPEPKAGTITTFLAMFFTGYILMWNLRSVPQLTFEMKEEWRRIANVLRLDQKWSMFAPSPLKADGWFVMDGKLSDGSPYDLLRHQPGPVSYEKPEVVSLQHPNARWRKYMINLNLESRRDFRLYFGKYTCRRFNLHALSDAKLQKFELVFVKELSRPPGVPLTTERIPLLSHDCFK